jgi:surface polysaccharide O-acyltransferase-like enzyme
MAAAQETVVATTPREAWVDNLRVLVVAGVIVVHTATGYITGVADWYYDEIGTPTVWSTVLTFPAVAGGLFGLGPLFFLAGWLSPPSVARRGAGGFVRSRLLRLGAPLVAFMLVVHPLADYVGSSRDENPTSLAQALRDTEFGVMWFVAALLAFSFAYAALRQVRQVPEGEDARGAGQTGHAGHVDHVEPAGQAGRAGRRRLGLLLVGAGLAIAVGSLLVWQVWPWNSNAFRTLRLGEWPQGAVLFALGVHAGETGWLREGLPTVVRRRLAWVGGIGSAATVLLFAFLDANDQAEAVLDDAAGWPTVLFALLDGTVAVSLSLWFLGWVRDRWPSRGPILERAARASYATYVVHPLVLTSVMVLLATAGLAPEAKFVLVSAVGVVACYVVGYALTRLPGVRRVV